MVSRFKEKGYVSPSSSKKAEDAYEYQKTLNRVRAHNTKLTWGACVRRATEIHERKSRKVR